MANVWLTGASGGIGQRLVEVLREQHTVVELGRRSSDPRVPACDLVHQVPSVTMQSTAHSVDDRTESKAATSAAATTTVTVAAPAREATHSQPQVDWIVHLATSYTTKDDLAMIDHLVEFARQHECENFLYFSSWVVHFPRRWFSAEYIRMKRQCEQRVRESGLKNVRIIRPSVVLGSGLSWSRILQKLAPFANWIPNRVSRSFTHVDDVCHQVSLVVAGELNASSITVLGQRQALSQAAWESVADDPEAPNRSGFLARLSSPRDVRAALLIGLLFTIGLAWIYPNTAAFAIPIALSVAIALVLTGLPYLIVHVAARLSDYFAGFVVRSFEPASEDDVIALVQECNQDVEVRGYDNQRIYFQNPPARNNTAVVLRKFDRVLELDTDRNIVRVESGMHFGNLLTYLESHGKWLANYPNYHFISVGACIATPVHGSNLEYPFIADLVESLKVYDREQDVVKTLRYDDEAFSQLIFNLRALRNQVVLSVDLRVTDRQMYVLDSKTMPVDASTFDQTFHRIGEEIHGQSDTHGAADTHGSADFHGASETNREANPQGESQSSQPDRLRSQHSEIRINAPWSSSADVQSYRQIQIEETESHAADGQLLRIKADSIGRKWNLLQRNGLTSACTSALASGFLNIEWFFSPDEFPVFWRAIHEGNRRPGFYKLLVRYNRLNKHLETPFHGTISIDITVFNHRRAVQRCVDLYRRFRPLEHLGKYSIERHLRRTP